MAPPLSRRHDDLEGRVVEDLQRPVPSVIGMRRRSRAQELGPGRPVDCDR